LRCHVAILGFGTVGSAVARRLTGRDSLHNVRLTYICDRHAAEKRGRLPDAGLRWTARIEDVIESDVDIVVETIGGVDPAEAWVRSALLAGKSVVTANKQLIARAGQPLLTLAARQGRQLRFEAAVGGAMPIVRAIGEGLAGDRLRSIEAILNGTTNSVLSRMEATGCTLDRALAEARAQGYAEADASLDLDGADAASKLAILCGLAFGVRVDPAEIATESAASIRPADFDRARQRGGTLRQIAHADFDWQASTLTAWVAPVAVSRASVFAQTVGAQNTAIVRGCYAGEIAISGAGAGGDATAVAVISDILAIARDRAAIVPPPVLTTPRAIVGRRTSNAEPSTSNPEPSTSNPEPSTSNPEPSTSNAEPSTSNPEPSASNPEPSTSNPEPRTSNPEPLIPTPYSLIPALEVL
jgi:homoserine dehydrogenase